MDSTNKVSRLLAKLNRLTADGKIAWNVKDAPPTLVHGTDDIIPLFFEAKYKDRWVALFERRTRAYDGDRDMFYWTQSTNFAVLDNEDRALWETSQHSPALHDLFSTVSEQASGIDGLLEDMLDDDEEETT
jgi:hypothetical protein